VLMQYTLLDTELGQIGLVGSSSGLRRIVLPRPSPEAVVKLITENFPGAIVDPAPFGDLPQRLRRYLGGEPTFFDDKLDLFHATSFRCAVWEVTRTIPHGETRSYGWVAQQVGKPGAQRAVGQALAKNPLPIVVPCHRVIGEDGSLTGFEGGLEMKKRLLEIEASLL
jgi:methylated-DNA-[protein]-cysteine S-methyltransferase